MPRRRAAPRLYLDAKRQQWVVRDGANFIRTGCIESDRVGAERRLADYLGAKHTPDQGSPSIADVLITYGREHVPHTTTARETAYNMARLGERWAGKSLADINAASCRAYAAAGSKHTARKDLEVLRAAIGYWHKNYGPLPARPVVVLPKKAAPRDQYLTREEAARLLFAARRAPHLARFILIGLYTGNRPGVTLDLTWAQIDLKRGVMYRRPRGRAEDARKRTPPVRLGPRILAHLCRWRRLDEALPAGPHVCRWGNLPVKRIRGALDAAVERAGLDPVTPHTFRHTRATWLMQAGIDIWQAAGSLGMTPAVLSQVYGHHSPNFQKEAAAV